MNTPETINIEKYAEALNNLIGIDSAYMVGDKDVDAIVEVIVAAKKLESRVKELEQENERLKTENDAAIEDLKYCMYFAKPKNNNTCNFCSHDCEDGMCRGREDWIECSPVWRGVAKAESEDKA